MRLDVTTIQGWLLAFNKVNTVAIATYEHDNITNGKYL